MRKRLMRTSLLTPISLALLFVAAGSAFSQTLNPTPNPTTLYQIIAKHSGKCLEVNGGPAATGNGALVVQQDCNSRENQQWTFTPVGAGYYKIIAKHSGKALDVFGGVFSAANGVIIEQWEYNGSGNQMWYLDDLHNGYYTFIARHSGKGLDIEGASTSNGARAHQWDIINGGGDNQQWKLIPALAPCARQ